MEREKKNGKSTLEAHNLNMIIAMCHRVNACLDKTLNKWIAV